MWALDSPRNLVLGLLTGIIFGFLLQRAGVTRYRTIMAQFLLVEHTVLRVMLTAVVVGSIGVYAMHEWWGVALHIKNAQLLGNAIGGIIFGVGMAILGYCPGTGFAAIGDGSRHAIPGVVGMIVGAGLYAELHSWFSDRVLSVWNFKKITIPAATGVSVWIYILLLAVGAIVLFRLLPRTSTGEPFRPAAG